MKDFYVGRAWPKDLNHILSSTPGGGLCCTSLILFIVMVQFSFLS